MIDLKMLRATAQSAADEGYVKTTITPRRLLELLDMLAAANLDAARYKFIEKRHTDPDGNLCVNIAYESQVVEYAYGKTWPDLSGAIDAAMAATKGEQA